jgi:hypothetical protein
MDEASRYFPSSHMKRQEGWWKDRGYWPDKLPHEQRGENPIQEACTTRRSRGRTGSLQFTEFEGNG